MERSANATEGFMPNNFCAPKAACLTWCGINRIASLFRSQILSLRMPAPSINFAPTAAQIEEIRQWLIEENESTGEGFYCNSTGILQSFRDNRIAVLISEQKAIRFLSWFDWGKIALLLVLAHPLSWGSSNVKVAVFSFVLE